MFDFLDAILQSVLDIDEAIAFRNEVHVVVVFQRLILDYKHILRRGQFDFEPLDHVVEDAAMIVLSIFRVTLVAVAQEAVEDEVGLQGGVEDLEGDLQTQRWRDVCEEGIQFVLLVHTRKGIYEILFYVAFQFFRQT